MTPLSVYPVWSVRKHYDQRCNWTELQDANVPVLSTVISTDTDVPGYAYQYGGPFTYRCKIDNSQQFLRGIGLGRYWICEQEAIGYWVFRKICLHLLYISHLPKGSQRRCRCIPFLAYHRMFFSLFSSLSSMWSKLSVRLSASCHDAPGLGRAAGQNGTFRFHDQAFRIRWAYDFLRHTYFQNMQIWCLVNFLGASRLLHALLQHSIIANEVFG
jgi:hypothetical protein